MNETDYIVKRVPLGIGEASNPNNYQALVRKDTNEVLNVVGDSYRLIQNQELFGEIESCLKHSLGEDNFNNVKIEEQVSKGGLWAKKEWIFPDITVETTKGSNSEIAFRVIGINAFGSSAVKCLFGGIDSYCTNGIIIGEQVGMIKKAHYGNYVIGEAMDPVRESVERFKESGEKWREWQEVKITADDARNFLDKHFTLRVAEVVLEQFKREILNRGKTLWALYSAMTAYASHENQFSVSQMSHNNRNVSTTMHKRELEVKKATETPDWNALKKVA